MGVDNGFADGPFSFYPTNVQIYHHLDDWHFGGFAGVIYNIFTHSN